MDERIRMMVEGEFNPNNYIIPAKGGFRIKGEPETLVFETRAQAYRYLANKFVFEE